MKMRSLSFLSGIVLSAAVIGSILVAPATAKKPPRPGPPPPPPPTPTSFNTYVKSYASVVDGVKCGLTPEVVQATSDGGSVALALSDRPSGAASDSCRGVNWLVKLDASGSPQWQEAVGCFGLPPGSYSVGVSLQQTTDGGYVIGGSTIGCGSTICPYLSGLQCGLIEKLDATGHLVWAQVYSIGRIAIAVNHIRQTSDGGFVAAGSTYDSSQNTGALSALILKVDGQGTLQWQRQLGQPGGPTNAYLNAVGQTADGGYVATGEFSAPSSCQYGHGCGQGVLVVKLDANGNLDWQRGFNSFDSSGVPTASEHAFSIIQTSDSGYLVAGNWGNSIGPGSCCVGALLLKLDASGQSQWQKSYSGGVHCFSNGFNTTCHAIGALAYSVHQTSDGGYSMAGLTNLKEPDSSPQVPWLAKTDASGNLLWQHAYYNTYPTTGRPVSQYFASSDLTTSGGYLALGFTENPTDLAGELLAVKTDSAGLVGACSQVRPATPLNTLDPGLATIALGLPVQAPIAAQDNSPSTTQPTSVSSTPGQC
jgi:hypothetical protein